MKGGPWGHSRMVRELEHDATNLSPIERQTRGRARINA
jgi:hypothetical protein